MPDDDTPVGFLYQRPSKFTKNAHFLPEFKV